MEDIKDETKSHNNTRRGLTARKYNKRILDRKNKIKDLYIRNHSQQEISTLLNVSQATVSRELKNMKEKLDKGLNDIGAQMLEDNSKWQLSVDEQIEKLYDILDKPNLDEKYKIKAVEMLLRLYDKKENLYLVRLDLFRIDLRIKKMIDKEEELRKKEKMLEAEREGRKLDWRDIWIRIDDNAIA